MVTIFAKHIGLQPKMYGCVNDDEQALKQNKGKGIPKSIVKQYLYVNDYIATLTDNPHKRHLSNNILQLIIKYFQ